METLGLPHAVSGNIKWYNATENSMAMPQKIKNTFTIWSSSSTCGYTLERTENKSQRNMCTPVFMAELFIIAKTCKQSKSPSMDECISKIWCVSVYVCACVCVCVCVCVYNGILFSLKKKGNSDRYYNTDEPQGRFAKWNKPVTKRQILYDSIYTKYLE